MGCDYSFLSSYDRNSSNSIEADLLSLKWKEKLTEGGARELFEADGTLPVDCPLQMLELRMHLADPLLLRNFGEYVNDQGALEYLICWIDILEYKEAVDITPEVQIGIGLLVFQKYVHSQCSLKLLKVTSNPTVGDEILRKLQIAKQTNVKASSDLFDVYQQECFKELHKLFDVYKGSVMYLNSMTNVKNAYNRIEPNDFEYFEELGQGGFGFVVHCRKKSTGIHYAMKIQTKLGMLECFGDAPHRVETEKQALATCNHPFIVSMDYGFQTRSLVMMVMDLGTGEIMSSMEALNHYLVCL